MIKLTRIDHRLIHGQVAFTWTKFLDIDCILVASDNIVNDQLKIDLLKMAKPQNIKLVIKSIQDSANAINEGKTDKYNLMILLENVEDAYKLLKLTSNIKELNLGGIKSEDNKKQISKAIYLNEQEIELLKDLDKNNIRIFIQMVPDENVQEFKEII